MSQTNVKNLLAQEHTSLDPRLREMLSEFLKFKEESVDDYIILIKTSI